MRFLWAAKLFLLGLKSMVTMNAITEHYPRALENCQSHVPRPWLEVESQDDATADLPSLPRVQSHFSLRQVHFGLKTLAFLVGRKQHRFGGWVTPLDMTDDTSSGQIEE
ncbi:hypothetical protein BDV09DRAFT_153638 [Aspergillus tetrazonus]